MTKTRLSRDPRSSRYDCGAEGEIIRPNGRVVRLDQVGTGGLVGTTYTKGAGWDAQAPAAATPERRNRLRFPDDWFRGGLVDYRE